MFCKHCGKQIYENSGTCPYCGAVVITEQESYEGAQQNGYEKSEISTKKIITLIVAIALVLISGVSGFFIGKKVSDDKNESIRQSEKEREKDEEDDDKNVFQGFGKKEDYVEVTTVATEVFDEEDMLVLEDDFLASDDDYYYETETYIVTEIVEVTGLDGEVVTSADGEVVTGFFY